MNIVQAPRASAILFHLLKSRKDVHPWLLPANICPIVPITFLKAEIPFELVDISAATLHMDLDQAEALVRTRRFGGLLYAHTYGEASTPVDFFRQVKQLDDSILLVDDRCLCLPGLQPDENNPADVQLFSTGYAKIVDLGQGGYAFLRDGISYQPLHVPFTSRDHERIEQEYKKALHDRTVFEYKDCDWLETDAELKPWLEYRQQIDEELGRSLKRRLSLNAMYMRLLPPEIQLPDGYQIWRFNIRVENKPQILKAIFDASLFASSHYASLAGVIAAGSAPQAERLAGEVINLFNDRHFDEQKVEKVCEVVKSLLP